MLRRVLERVSRNRVLKRRLPSDFGSRPIYVSPDAALRFWRYDLERTDPILFRLARKLVKRGDVVWDVGANLGIFSFAAAAVAGKSGSVVSVEADPWLSGLLRRSASTPFADHAPVSVISAAVADRLSVGEFNIANRGRCSNFVSGFGTTQTNGSRSSLPLVAVTLDWLASYFPKPVVLKIDIEGMDHLALRGGTNILSTRPIVIIEVQANEAEGIATLLKQFGYNILDTDLRPVRELPYDVVAIPG